MLLSIMVHGLLSEYLSSVYKFKRSHKYANVFKNMLNLIAELFWNNIQLFQYFKNSWLLPKTNS